MYVECNLRYNKMEWMQRMGLWGRCGQGPFIPFLDTDFHNEI
jgi:hypothetical protein